MWDSRREGRSSRSVRTTGPLGAEPYGFLVDVGLGVGVGDAEPDGLGVADGVGVAVGDGVAVGAVVLPLDAAAGSIRT